MSDKEKDKQSPPPPLPPLEEAVAEEIVTQEEAATQEIAELREKLLRAQAEMENNRKRQERELEKARITAVESFARDLLGVLDDIRRAQESWEKIELDSSVKEGLALILSSTEHILSRYQIKRIEAKAQKFDPNLHEALFEDPTSQAQAGTITQIIEEGYMLGERLLRPARVAVAGGGGSQNSDKTE